MSMQEMNLTEVMSNQRQLQLLQIAIDRSQVVLDQLSDNQVSMKWNLGSAITHLKMAEADLSVNMGFDWHAKTLRESCTELPATPDNAVEAIERTLALAKQQLNNYKSIGQK